MLIIQCVYICVVSDYRGSGAESCDACDSEAVSPPRQKGRVRGGPLGLSEDSGSIIFKLMGVRKKVHQTKS